MVEQHAMGAQLELYNVAGDTASNVDSYPAG